jgi:hypothetical protein
MGRLAFVFGLVLTLVGGAGALADEKKAPAEIGGLRLISGAKGQRPHIPGLNAALLLTPDQRERLAAAHAETLGSEAVIAASRKVKGDPNASEADRAAARKLAEDAQAAFDRRVQEVLTPAQRELVGRFQVLYGQAQEAVAQEYGPRLVGSKGNPEETRRLRAEAAEKLAAEAARRVSEVLSLEQRAAFERAAALERERAATKAKPLP